MLPSRANSRPATKVPAATTRQRSPRSGALTGTSGRKTFTSAAGRSPSSGVAASPCAAAAAVFPPAASPAQQRPPGLLVPTSPQPSTRNTGPNVVSERPSQFFQGAHRASGGGRSAGECHDAARHSLVDLGAHAERHTHPYPGCSAPPVTIAIGRRAVELVIGFGVACATHLTTFSLRSRVTLLGPLNRKVGRLAS